MDIEKKLRELAEIQRPFSRPLPATVGAAYFIDNTFAFRIVNSNEHTWHVSFAADKQLPIYRERAKKDREQHGIGIGLLALTFDPNQRAIYLGNKYKFLLISEHRSSFQLQSTNPINYEAVPSNIDLRELVAQRALSLKI